MKIFIKKHQLILIFFGTGLLCTHNLHAMRASEPSSQETIIFELNTALQQTLFGYRTLSRLTDRETHTITARRLDQQLGVIHDTLHKLTKSIPPAGASLAFNTRCAQLMALLERVDTHITRAHEALASNITTSQYEFDRACTLKAHLFDALSKTTTAEDPQTSCLEKLAYEGASVSLHTATSEARAQTIIPGRFAAFCSGLTSLVRGGLLFARQEQEEQLKHASSQELLDTLGVTESTESRISFDELAYGSEQHGAFDKLANEMQQGQELVDGYAPTAKARLRTIPDYASYTPRIQQALRVMCTLAQKHIPTVIEKLRKLSKNPPRTRQGVEFVLDPTTWPIILRTVQRLPNWSLRFALQHAFPKETSEEIEEDVSMINSAGIQPSDVALLHPKLIHQLNITEAQIEQAKRTIPPAIEQFLSQANQVDRAIDILEKTHQYIPLAHHALASGLAWLQRQATPEHAELAVKALDAAQRFMPRATAVIDRASQLHQEALAEPARQAAQLKALATYDQQVQHKLHEQEGRIRALKQQMEHDTAQNALKQLLAPTFPFTLTPTQAILLGARTIGESPELRTRTPIRSVFLQRAHSQDAL